MRCRRRTTTFLTPGGRNHHQTVAHQEMMTLQVEIRAATKTSSSLTMMSLARSRDQRDVNQIQCPTWTRILRQQ